MTILTHNFDGGPNGTTITVTNSAQVAGNTPLSGVFTSGANTECKYSNDFPRPTAEYTAKFSTGAATGQSLVYWTGTTMSQLWMRAYVYFSQSLDNFPEAPVFFAAETSLGVTACNLAVDSIINDELIFSDSLGNAFSTTSICPVGAWFRVEARIQFSATTGNCDVRLYLEADAALDDYTEQISLTNKNLAANSVVTYYFGYATNDPDLEPLYLSNIAVSDETWIGPAPFRAGKGVPGILPNPMAIHVNAW